MLFNSLQFVVFFIVVVSLYFLIPQKFRWSLLLVASCYFYMAFIPWYILILLFLILIDFFLGKKIERTQDQKSRLHWLWISVFSNVGALFIFKYFNFFNTSLADLTSFLHWNYSPSLLSIALPLGLSFHTFQSLSYVIEVYRGRVNAEKHLGIYALYVMFFPQLVAGPIERPEHMLPQFKVQHHFSYPRFILGLQRMIWGFFKKIVIADNLAVLVNIVYGNLQEFNGPTLTLATVFFAFQIYCDFSGYCDIALGAAQVLGFELSENFNAPYFSSSVSDFWRRWHITLSSWFRDYVYFPLGGSKDVEYKVVRNLLITFLLSGLWHGANWTFVLWGLINGIYLVVGRWNKNFLPKTTLFAPFFTFILTCFAWIFFRAKNLKEAWYVVTHLGVGWGTFLTSFGNMSLLEHSLFFDRVSTDLFVAIFVILVLVLVEGSKYQFIFLRNIFTSSVVVRTVAYTTLIFLIGALWEGRGTEFIYFQF